MQSSTDKAWFGQKKVAFIPVARRQIDSQPPDWEEQILRRLYYDPAPLGDVSLRTFIQRVSHGRADIDGAVLPRVELDQLDVPPTALSSRTGALRDQGFDAAALVMLGGPGAGTAERLGFWTRFVMLENVGVWGHELIHLLTHYGDLWAGRTAILPDHLGSFDTMAGAGGSHLSAYTKRALGWIDAEAVTHHVGRLQVYELHDVGLSQPPPRGRTSAVEIGPYVVEAREMVDQFDARIATASGAPPEGVIIYEVESPDIDSDALLHPLVHLRTPDPVQPGGVYKSPDGLVVQVASRIAGGFAIRIDDLSQPLDLEEGQLLFYRDESRDGSSDVHSPSVIGLGGWQFMRHLTYGGDGILYAVDGDGRLLFYRDAKRDGTGDVNTPGVIGSGGWQNLLRLFAGDPGVLYAVDAGGQLLFYRDHARDGTGDVHTPSVIGRSGWQDVQHLVYGGDGIIYAVDNQGQLLFYRDHTRDGTGDVNTPSVIGLGGWQDMQHLTYGGDGILYAVDSQGQLLFYRDTTRNGTGDVNTPAVIGLGGWQQMKYLVAGDGGIIYAVVG